MYVQCIKSGTIYRLRGSFNLRNDASEASQKTHIYRVSDGQWHEVEDIPTGRLNNFCGQGRNSIAILRMILRMILRIILRFIF